MAFYEIRGNDLCIIIPLEAIAELATDNDVVLAVKDKRALGLALGRELCECEDEGGDYHINRPLDDALERVIESADKSLQYADDDQ